jgi:hypothetical protein
MSNRLSMSNRVPTIDLLGDCMAGEMSDAIEMIRAGSDSALAIWAREI